MTRISKWVAKIVGMFGYPKGPVNAVELWNEPWDGVSIPVKGADMLRYREIYTTWPRAWSRLGKPMESKS